MKNKGQINWPLRHAEGDRLLIQPTLCASSGETLRQLALAGEGIVWLSHFMQRSR
jgi:DNA-binding transcriptional LysR family regulator